MSKSEIPTYRRLHGHYRHLYGHHHLYGRFFDRAKNIQITVESTPLTEIRNTAVTGQKYFFFENVDILTDP